MRSGADVLDTPVLDRDEQIPLWIQLRLVLRRQIDSGALPPGERLPSEAELCERFNVSRTVVREALGQLVTEGRVYKIKGKGTFVAKRKSEGEFVGTTMGLWEEMKSKGRQVRTQVLEQRLDSPSERIRVVLHLHEDDLVLHLRRLYMVDEVPTILVSTYLPPALVPGLEKANLENRSLYETIRQRYGLVPFRAERWIEALLPSREDAALLDVSPRTPLLGIESVATLANSTPFEYYTALYRTDDARLHIVTG